LADLARGRRNVAKDVKTRGPGKTDANSVSGTGSTTIHLEVEQPQVMIDSPVKLVRGFRWRHQRLGKARH